MKKSFKVFAFCFAMMFAFLPFSVLAIEAGPCPSHPDSYNFHYESYNPEIHKKFCGECTRFLGYEDCYWVNPYECTEIPYCMWCDNTRDPVATEHSPLKWIKLNSTLHQSGCKHTTLYGSPCAGRLVERHNFVNGVCVDCNYVANS